MKLVLSKHPVQIIMNQKALWYKSVFDIYELLCNILDEGFLTADWKQLMMPKYKFSFHVAFSNECLVTVIKKRRPRF